MSSEYIIVTQCFYPDIGGIEGLMTGLADHVAAEGRTVTVLAERIRQNSRETSTPKPYEIVRFGGPRPWRRWRKRKYLEGLVKERGSKIAGLFVDSWKSIEALPQRLGLPVAMLAHGMEYPQDATGHKRARIAAALKRCRAIIANSRYTSARVLPYLEGDKAKLHIIHPPIEPMAEPDAEAKADILSRLGARRPVITTVARLEPRKGIDAVLRAMPEVLARHPRCLYAVAGAGEDRERLERLAAELNVSDAVLFLGRISDREKAALLAESDVFAMPVRREGASVEGFGMVYSEAGWFGLPVLGGAEGGAGDAVVHGETGLLCDGASHDEVVAGLLSLLDDDGLRKRLGAAARLRVRTDLVWPAVVGRYLDSFAHTGPF